MTKPNIHFIGIGGIGTSALARWFLSQGYKVSGSDVSFSSTIKELRKEGVKIFIGHKAKNVPKQAELVVFSAAVPKDNPELRAARRLDIPTKSYAQVLGQLTLKYKKTIAVTGAHGKGTTTALLSLVLIKSGLNPTVIIGTKLKEFKNSNFRKGKGDYFIIEADEYNEHFLHHSPFAAIITNIDREHLDYFKDLTTIKKAFLRFIKNIRPNGILVVNRDNKNLFNLKNRIQKIAKKNRLKVYWYSISVNQRLNQRISAFLKIPGEHNLSNALGVYTLAQALGAKNKNIFSALSSYHGAWRRMEYRGKFIVHCSSSKVDVYDDYAHHPTEVKATLKGLAKKYPAKKIICVFQPHQAKRLKALFKEFTTAFDDAKSLILLDIYRVPGRDKVSRSVNSGKLARAIRGRLESIENRKKQAEITLIRLKTIIYLPSPKQGQLKSILRKLITNDLKLKNSLVVMMGAGDIYKLTDKLVKS